jgi:hypothetical protein
MRAREPSRNELINTLTTTIALLSRRRRDSQPLRLLRFERTLTHQNYCEGGQEQEKWCTTTSKVRILNDPSGMSCTQHLSLYVALIKAIRACKVSHFQAYMGSILVR